MSDAVLQTSGLTRAFTQGGETIEVLAMQFANLVWLVLPGLRLSARPLLWSDPFAWSGVALLMAAAWRQTRRRLVSVQPEEDRA